MKLAAIPRLYLGTMTFAWGSQTSSIVDEGVAVEMTKRFLDANDKMLGVTDGHRIDTARVYAGGKTEQMVGAAIRGQKDLDSNMLLLVGTKAHPSVQPGGLSPKGMQAQLQKSLEEMQLTSVEEYYLHQPDTEHSLLESLQCAHEMVEKGLCKTIGMSNYHASEMARAYQLCKDHGLTPPRVYQGLYNPINRLVEDELLPVLRENGCSFVAYNPLAAGLLSGKHKSIDQVKEGRFKDNQNYLPRFYTDHNFKAIELIRKACDKEGISMVEATYRWLLRHSSLTPSDGVLVGASSLEQLDQNLNACTAAATKDELSPGVLDAFEQAWQVTRQGSFPYWRSYSLDMPNREFLDQGASYNAAKTK